MKTLTAALLVALVHLVGCSPVATDDETDGTGGNGSAAFVLPATETPWTETVADYSCTHVKVEKNCKDGWCKVPAGCFVMGSPDEEPFHGPITEKLRPVVITRSFVMMATEVTQKAWLELAPANPSGPNLEDPTTPAGKFTDCIASDCPVGHVNWFEAVEYANRLSRKESRQECFILKNCTGDLGARPDQGQPFVCEQDYKLATPSVYDCGGYRLPTDAEFEYAARAGTRTAFYSGDLTTEYMRECTKVHTALDSIAWYCANSGNASHAVARKLANRWGLFDLLGNADEWNHNRSVMPNPGDVPLVGPLRADGQWSRQRQSRDQGRGVLARPGISSGRGSRGDPRRSQGSGYRLPPCSHAGR